MDDTYQAWEVTRYGGPDVLRPLQRHAPVPADGALLVRIRASAVSRADCLMRAGKPRFARLFLGLRRPKAGLAGTCFAGEVVAVGAGVTEFAIGDAVFGEAGLQFGANATHIAIPASGSLVKKPESLSFEEAATLFDGAMTSWHFLTRVAPVSAGQQVLILAGSGSLGSAAVQFATARGAWVTATASGRNGDLLASLGADRVIDYTVADPLAGDARYAVIFDTIGVASFGIARPALAEGGRYICPVLSGRLLRDVVLSRISGDRRALFAAAGMAPPEVHRAEMAQVLQLAEAGRFRPVMDRTFPLGALPEAHAYVETGRKRGNVVLV